MGAAAAGLIPLDADEKLARMVLDAAAAAMRIPVPDEILPADRARPGPLRRHRRRRRCPAIARIMAPAGRRRSPAATTTTPRSCRRCASSACPCHLGYDAEPRRRRRHRSWSPPRPARTTPRCSRRARRGLRILPRSAGLKSVMAGRRVLAVAGTHGKTTTTSLLTMALRAAGADPTYAIGGVLAATGRNADAGAGDLFVAEADESDGAFLVYRPHAAIVTNVDADHLDVWGTEEAYRAAFDEFVGPIDPRRLPGLLRRRPRRRRAGRRRPGTAACAS